MTPSNKRRSQIARSCVVLGVWMICLVVRAEYTVVVNPAKPRGAWEGWGVSLSWWANVFGSRNDLADLLFTTNYTTLNGQSLPGLGLNIARYNVGGCSSSSANGSYMQVSPNIPAFKQIRGFWLDWNSADPASASWNWNADANQRAMLLKAKARGANLFELFSNSPMWWMCYNHNPSGSDNGWSDNLQSWNHRQHAVYLATVAKYAADQWGIVFNSVEPFNEPSASWWTAAGTQEGCHFDRATQATVVNYLRAELNGRGLSQVSVAASDETSYDDATATWLSFDSFTRSNIGRVNVHGYQYGGGRRDLLFQAVQGKRLWNSEYGEGDASGVSLASNLNLDFRWLRMTAWCYWQPFDSGGWGLVQSNPGDNWIGTANPKYHVLAHYTRHIRPGMTLIETDDGNTVAAYDRLKRRLVLVTMNYETEQWVNLALTNFYTASAGPVRRWRTPVASAERYRLFADSIRDGVVRVWFPANTIQTVEIDNIYLTPPPPLSISLRPAPASIELSWPTWGSNFALHTVSQFPAGNWAPVTNQPLVDGGLLRVRLTPAPASERFFRLVEQ